MNSRLYRKVIMKSITNKGKIAGGAIISYILIILNALYGIILMPYIINNIGSAEYGVYRTIASFSSAFMILDLGLGGTVMRYIAKFKIDGEEQRIPSFIGMCLIEAFIMSIIIAMGSIIIYFSLDLIYSNGLTSYEIYKAKQLFIFLSLTVICHVFENVLNGVITGSNEFIVGNGIKLIRLIFRIILTFILLIFFKKSIILVIIDLFLILGMIAFEILYIKHKLKVDIKYNNFELKLFIDSFKYTIFTFLTAIVAQVNTNLDNVVIGAIVGSVSVTIYSLSLQIFNIFTQISTSISGVMLPLVTEYLKNDDDKMSNTKKLIIQVGRIQFSLLFAVFIGFVLFGKNFINIWMGRYGFEDLYYISIILMIPAIFELCVNVNISILRAKNMMGFRTIVLLISTILNLFITITGTYYWNYYGAAFGTAISIIFGSLIVMNLYYKRNFGFNMMNIYFQIFNKIWICILISGIASILVTINLKNDISIFTIGGISFILIYTVSMYLYGLNKDEKDFIKRIHKKVRNKFKNIQFN